MDESLNITLEMVGSPAEQGHVSLGDFMGQLNHLTNALKAVDRSFDPFRKETLYYRVVDLSRDTTTKVTVQPVAKRNKKHVPVATDPLARHDFFFFQPHSIREESKVSERLTNEDFEAFRSLALPTAKTVSEKTVHNSLFQVKLDEKLEMQVSKLLAEETRSFGTLQGKLERINLHNRQSFSIYPLVGPNSVYCEFSPSLRELVKTAIDKHVKVRGTKTYRAGVPYPHRMRVESLEILDDSNKVSLLELRGMSPHLTGDLDSETFVRSIREQWTDD